MDRPDSTVFDPAQVKIEVMTTYLPSHSQPEHGQYTFAYTITISNRGDIPVQLLSRHWVITNADNERTEVRGDGVVGEQPLIKPGEAFRYTSGATLTTPVGCMEGSYTMIALPPGADADTSSARKFQVPISTFSLHKAAALH
jgi:ApaG protein